VLIGIELLHPAHFTAEPGTVAFLSQPQPYDPRHVALAYFAVLAAAVFAAAALWRARRAPLPACVVLVAFGWQLQTSHASPHGPIAFVLLIVGAIWIRLWQRHAAISDADARRPSRRSASR
jgi:hypothetical protein